MRRALIVGGTGMIGRAAARRLLAAGWWVAVTGRDPAHFPPDLAASGAQFIAVERGELAAALGSGVDLLVDCVCYTADHAKGLLPLTADANSVVMISTQGRVRR